MLRKKNPSDTKDMTQAISQSKELNKVESKFKKKKKRVNVVPPRWTFPRVLELQFQYTIVCSLIITSPRYSESPWVCRHIHQHPGQYAEQHKQMFYSLLTSQCYGIRHKKLMNQNTLCTVNINNKQDRAGDVTPLRLLIANDLLKRQRNKITLQFFLFQVRWSHFKQYF